MIGNGFSAYAQSDRYNEIGFIIGPVAFQSDFGQRGNTPTNFGNMGFGIGITHHLDFSYRRENYFNRHFKVRNELTYHKTNLRHFGRYAQSNSTFGKQLRAMRGVASVVSFGTQLDWYINDIHDFAYTDDSFAPYFGLGLQAAYYRPNVYSTLGPLGTTATTPTKFMDAYRNDPSLTWAITSNLGTRYKLGRESDLMVEFKWSFYFSNWVDGLSPDPNKYPENKTNDWNFWVAVGYVYYLD